MNITKVEIIKLENVYTTTIFRWDGDVFTQIGSAQRPDAEAALEMVKKELEIKDRYDLL